MYPHPINCLPHVSLETNPCPTFIHMYPYFQKPEVGQKYSTCMFHQTQQENLLTRSPTTTILVQGTSSDHTIGTHKVTVTAQVCNKRLLSTLYLDSLPVFHVRVWLHETHAQFASTHFVHRLSSKRVCVSTLMYSDRVDHQVLYVL